MNMTLQCRCGTVRGQLSEPQRACRALCYCRDCQAFARFLGHPEQLLDAAGGTDVIATLPRFIQFTAGTGQLACMSLAPRGLYRWYAACCRTPLANTPRNPKFSYVGLPSTCIALSPEGLRQAFGPPRLVVHAAAANGPVTARPQGRVAALLRVVGNVAGARIGGGWRSNPFFSPGSAVPVRTPEILSLAQHSQLRGDAA